MNKGGGMKKVYSIAGGILLVLAVAFTGNAIASGTDGSGQTVVQPTESSGNGQVATSSEKISGTKDKRLINSKMNYRQRMDMQRAVQRRAAANRNILIQQAREKERKLDSE